jgi:diphthamide biosynthesis methyltransferase
MKAEVEEAMQRLLQTEREKAEKVIQAQKAAFVTTKSSAEQMEKQTDELRRNNVRFHIFFIFFFFFWCARFFCF